MSDWSGSNAIERHARDPRYKIVGVSYEAVLCNLFRKQSRSNPAFVVVSEFIEDLPDDTEIISVHSQECPRSFLFTLWSSHFPLVTNFNEYPRIEYYHTAFKTIKVPIER